MVYGRNSTTWQEIKNNEGLFSHIAFKITGYRGIKNERHF
jgi:hypothetical protein